MFKAITFSVIMIVACMGVANAACEGGSCSDVKIDLLYINAAGVLIQTDGDQSQLNCGPSTTYLKLLNTHPNHEKIYAALLTVFETKRNINRIRVVEGPTSECAVSYVVTTNP